jgi:outer membrane protein TolC
MKRRPPTALGALLLAGGLAGPGHAASQSLPLASALDSAFATHPALARAEALELGAAEGASTVRGTRWPSLSLRSALTHFQEPMLATPIHAFDPNLLPEFDETLWQSQLFARYTLLDWGSRSGRVGTADAQLHAAEAATRATQLQLIETVAEAYLRVLSARALDTAAGARIEALEEERARAERGLAAGTAAEVELLRASVALQDAEANRTTTSGAVLLAERTLARVIGTTPDRIASATLSDVGAFRLAEGGPPGDSVNPVVEQAARRAEAARSRSSSERGPRWPRLDLSAGVNHFGTLDLAPIFEWQAGVSLTWDIFSGGARSATVRQAEAELRAAESELASIELDVATAVDAARTSTEAADARVGALTASVEQWEELVRIEGLALEAGAGTQRDLLDAEAGLYQARAGLVEATSEAFLARVRLAGAEGRLDRTWIVQMSGGS